MTTDPFEGKAAFFDEHYRSLRGRVRLEVVLRRLSRVLPPPPASILDAGGGTGAFAVPLAQRGYDVTLLDPSREWRDAAAARAAEAGVELRLVEGTVEEATDVGGPFDVLLCHAVLAYSPDPERALRRLRQLAVPGAVLSSLEKNRGALAVRPALEGDLAEARRVLDDPMAAGRLGIVNRAFSHGELRAMLVRTGWRVRSWGSFRMLTDLRLEEVDDEQVDAAVDLEVRASRHDPLRQVGRLLHVLAEADPPEPERLAELQRRSFEKAAAATRGSFAPQDAMPAGRLEEFLSRKLYAAVSTTRPDGGPHAAMVGFCFHQGRFCLPAVAGAQRLRNLAHEPTLSLIVAEGEGDQHELLQAEADAIVHDDPRPHLDGFLRDLWHERFGSELTWAGAVIEVIPRKVLSYLGDAVR